MNDRWRYTANVYFVETTMYMLGEAHRDRRALILSSDVLLDCYSPDMSNPDDVDMLDRLASERDPVRRDRLRKEVEDLE